MEKELSSNPHKYYREHLLQMILLAGTFISGLGILFQITNLYQKLVVIFFLSAIYCVFGIWHHLEEKNLTRNHILEYLAISSFIFVILFSIFAG